MSMRCIEKLCSDGATSEGITPGYAERRNAGKVLILSPEAAPPDSLVTGREEAEVVSAAVESGVRRALEKPLAERASFIARVVALDAITPPLPFE